MIMKRFLISSLMTLTLMSASAYDFSYTNTFLDELFQSHEHTLYYAVNEDGNTVSVVAGPETYDFELAVIPETVEHNGKTYTVTIIGNDAFNGGNLGARLTMPNTITQIQSRAFANCRVDSVAFSTGLKTIGDYAFNRCSLTSVYLHEGVTSIGDYAFAALASWSGTGRIRVAMLPESLTTLGTNLFEYQVLHRVKLPSNLKTIPAGTFAYCSELRNIDLPVGLEKIGDNAFDNAGLITITFPSTLKEIGGSAFYRTLLQNVVLPNSVETIGGVNNMYGVFSHNYYLESVTLSSGMKNIPENAFLNCNKLTKVNIPVGITSIGTNAFSHCTLLSNITLPEGLTELGYSVFGGSGIRTIQLPSTLNYIGDGMFYQCCSLTSFTIPSTITEIKDGAFSGCENLVSVIIPESVQSMGKRVFSNTALTEVNIPPSITMLGDDTFYQCKKLSKVALPEGLTVIGEACFQDCKVLTDIVFPSTLTTIYNGAFEDCPALKELTFPSSLESWGGWVFNGCKQLTAVHIYRLAPPTGNYPYAKDLIDQDNQCILYVPTGSKTAYESMEEYRNFKDIREEELPAFTLTYLIDGKEYASYEIGCQKTIVPEQAPEKEGYTFSGWSEIPELMPSHDVTISGAFTINQYNVKFIVDGEVVSEQKLDYGTKIDVPEVAEKEGYTCSGWSEVPETVPAHDVTITASYTVNTYTLVYMVDGMEYQKTNVDYGTALTAEAEPTKEGYSFSGWSEVPETMPSHDVTITGAFTVNKYKIRYYVGEGLIAEDEVEYGAEVVLRNYTPEDADRYTFIGWEGENYETMPAHDIEYHANIADGIYNLSTLGGVEAIYDANGRKLRKLQRGVNVVVMSDGTKKKVVVK